MNYIPGWDCHGLPIELKALQEAPPTTSSTSRDLNTTAVASASNEAAIAIRDCAQAFADKTIDVQKEAFRSWNIVADWDNGCYLSYDPQFEAAQLELFYQMYQVRLMKNFALLHY